VRVRSRVNGRSSTPVDNPVDAVWTVVHSLWTRLWGVVDRPVGDTPGALAHPLLTSENDRAYDVDEKNRADW